MPFPQVVAVAGGSPAEDAGVEVGDEVRSLNGIVPRDIIEWRLLTDEGALDVALTRNGEDLELEVHKAPGAPLGIEVASPLFDRVRTCDNHCEFCFIYQLPKGMRKSLYVKDDDYRLSFLYGNFTTLTRFTELDLERVLTERLSPLYVSIHATDPEVRSRMLRNRRGAMSLRWLRALLDGGIEVHGQIVLCPGVNDGPVLEETCAGILETYPELASVAVVPLGVSRFSKERAMRPHTSAEAAAVLATIERWQERFLTALGRRMCFAADEYYLLAGRPFPSLAAYEGLPQEENGIGVTAAFTASFAGRIARTTGHRGGFFASVDGAPATGYRAPRGPVVASSPGSPRAAVDDRPSDGSSARTYVLTGRYGAMVLRDLLADSAGVEVVGIENDFFGGNIGVAGLLTGADVARALLALPADARFLLPDVCLSEGHFLDGVAVSELPRPVEVLPTTGAALAAALGRRRSLVGAGALRGDSR
jgi:putative radical SAM enzyme (TIGR03279 family)